MINKRLKIMQLSLIDEIPELNKVFFLDIFAESYYDNRRSRMKLTTIQGQQIPANIKVSCPSKLIGYCAEGTIFKLDARLVRREGKQPYFIAINRQNLQRAIEFFDYNLKVQNGFDYEVDPAKKETHKISKLL